LLFSDIEGSTALLGRLGEQYGEALSAQRAMLRAAIADSSGRELGTEGDSFFVVFESAVEAVGCAVAAQRALCGHDWPGGVAVRVRMGLHSGEPVRHEDGYVGMAVHLAVRWSVITCVFESSNGWRITAPGQPLPSKGTTIHGRICLYGSHGASIRQSRRRPLWAVLAVS
jgi:adenylate/guanylate cyclase family protein